MKTLIYTLCYGEPYLPMFGTWLRALRGAGRYRGDVAVVTDLSPDRFAAAGLERLRVHASREWLDLSVYYEKTSILELAGLDDYDALLYVDADIVTVNDLAPVLEACRRAPGPLLNRSRHDMAWEYNAGLLDDSEREQVRRSGIPGVNAGCFGASRSFFRSLLERWRLAFRVHHESGRPVPLAGDQPFLNRMVLRGEVPSFEFLPDGWLRDWLSYLGRSDIRELRARRLKLVHLPGDHPPEEKTAIMRRLGRRAEHAKAWYGYLTTDRLLQPWQRIRSALRRRPA